MFELPPWLQFICCVILGGFVLFIVRGIYENYLKTIFARRKVVKARLISKVKENYKELRTAISSSSKIVPSSGLEFSQGQRMGFSKYGIAYRLYFDVSGKIIELDVTEKIFDSLEEDSIGMLDYKGNYYYDFVVEKVE